jgi:hypothetical protein
VSGAGKGALRRRFRYWLAALVLLAGCTSSGSAAPARKASSAAPSTGAVEPATGAAAGSWRRIAEPPIPPAAGMAAAWTGRLLVVWGGGAGGPENWRPAGAGAAYDPAADRWDALPPAPVAGRNGTTAVWTGREVLFWGGAAGHDTFLADGAAYDPATRQWRVLPAAPIGPRAEHQAVWTGREMLVWGGITRCCPVDSELHDPAAAAYDPATNQWSTIAVVPPPWSGDDGTAVTMVAPPVHTTAPATGQDGTAGGRQPAIWRHGRLALYDRDGDAWTEAPGTQPPPLPGDAALPSTTGDPFALGTAVEGDVFTWTGKAGELQGLAWRPSDGTWRRTATLEAQSGASITAGEPGRIFAAAGQSARVLEYRIGDDRWEELPLPPVNTRSAAVLVWTGSELLFWGGMGDEGPEMDGAIWH